MRLFDNTVDIAGICQLLFADRMRRNLKAQFVEPGNVGLHIAVQQWSRSFDSFIANLGYALHRAPEVLLRFFTNNPDQSKLKFSHGSISSFSCSIMGGANSPLCSIVINGLSVTPVSGSVTRALRRTDS